MDCIAEKDHISAAPQVIVIDMVVAPWQQDNTMIFKAMMAA